MIKDAQIKEGHTPSIVSGKKSTMIKKGEAVAAGEKPPEAEASIDDPTIHDEKVSA